MIVRKNSTWLIVLITGVLLVSCQVGLATQEVQDELSPPLLPEGISPEEAATLASLEQVNDFPLYTMVYQNDYPRTDLIIDLESDFAVRTDWACSLFAALGDPDQVLLGRNFDWDFSPGLLLYTDPDPGYASVSMVDLDYLGYGYEQAFGLTNLSLEELKGLLYAPFIPFDGMNEAGLAVGMAAVPDGGAPPDPKKETIDSVLVIRKILDKAATIEEAVAIIQTYNIDWGSGPALHYLIAEKSGRSVLVEFSSGELVVQENQHSWQVATNFLVSEAGSNPAGHCWRYGMIDEQLESNRGVLQMGQAMDLLDDVAQQNTQWSVIYQISSGDGWIAMGRDFPEIFKFDMHDK
jgi:hypothetical protein